MNREIKLICSDIDGTLIKADQTIGDITRKAVIRATECGIHFALATGRFKTGASSIEQKLGLPFDKLSGVYDNGAYVEANGKRVKAEGVRHSVILEISRLAKEYNARPVLFSGEEWIVEESDKWWAQINGFYEGRGVVDTFENTLRKALASSYQEPVKLVLRHDDPETITRLREDLNKRYPDLFFFLSHSDILEVSMKHVDKGSGVKDLADYFGITLDNIMAFGDFDNDIPMLKAVKYGVAMENGTKGAKEIASFYAPSNEDDGVGKMINKLLFEE